MKKLFVLFGLVFVFVMTACAQNNNSTATEDDNLTSREKLIARMIELGNNEESPEIDKLINEILVGVKKHLAKHWKPEYRTQKNLRVVYIGDTGWDKLWYVKFDTKDNKNFVAHGQEKDGRIGIYGINQDGLVHPEDYDAKIKMLYKAK